VNIIKKKSVPENLNHLREPGTDNFKMDLTETGCNDVDWIHLAQEIPVADSCEHGNEHWRSTNGREFLD
jgi:hypothetical protein